MNDRGWISGKCVFKLVSSSSGSDFIFPPKNSVGGHFGYRPLAKKPVLGQVSKKNYKMFIEVKSLLKTCKPENGYGVEVLDSINTSLIYQGSWAKRVKSTTQQRMFKSCHTKMPVSIDGNIFSGLLIWCLLSHGQTIVSLLILSH